MKQILNYLAVAATTAWLGASLYAADRIGQLERGNEQCEAQQVVVPYQILKGVK